MSGAGDGTIMSYCHLLSGGLSNISRTFGEGHSEGVSASGRVSERMARSGRERLRLQQLLYKHDQRVDANHLTL